MIINICYEGATNSYNVELNGECIYSTHDRRNADLFKAELLMKECTNVEYKIKYEMLVDRIREQEKELGEDLCLL